MASKRNSNTGGVKKENVQEYISVQGLKCTHYFFVYNSYFFGSGFSSVSSVVQSCPTL